MTPYHVAKLVEWAGVLRTRKRLQKVVYLLRSAGCDVLDADFVLHHYGPYSAEVAAVADQMSSAKLLEERSEQNPVGVQYCYSLTDRAREQLVAWEKGIEGRKLAARIQPFEKQARKLLNEDLATLEYGSTVVYFYQQTKDWAQATEKACKFKKIQPQSDAARGAVALAKSVVN